MCQLDDPDDRFLVRLICTGDQQAVALLLQHHGGPVRAHLRRRFPSLRDSEIHDVLVDAVLKLLDTFDPERGRPGGWLLFLANRIAIDVLRKGASRGVMEVPVGDWEFADPTSSPLENLMDHERLDAVHDALDALSPLERGVIQADLDACGTACATRLAECFDTTEGSIYAARRRARLRLLEILGRKWPELWDRDADNDAT